MYLCAASLARLLIVGSTDALGGSTLQHILEVLDPQFRGASIEPITVGQSGSKVYRLHPSIGLSVILKTTRPDDMPDYLTSGYPHIGVAEYRFYTELLPRLQIPAPKLLDYGTGRLGEWYLLLEDLSTYCYIPPVEHVWTTAEVEQIVATYAMLHGRSEGLLRKHGVPPWLNPDPRATYRAQTTKTMFLELYQNNWTRELVAPIVESVEFEPLLLKFEQALGHEPPALLFNDFYPPNVALPRSAGPARLLDFQLVGAGPCHIDLVNIGFLGGTTAFSRIDRHRVLAHYLDRLEQETGKRRTTERFLGECKSAAVLACADFLPRVVRAMRRSNKTGEPWSQWMQETYTTCMNEWANIFKS